MVQKRKKLKARRVKPRGSPQGRRKKTSNSTFTISIEAELRRVFDVFSGKKKKKGWF